MTVQGGGGLKGAAAVAAASRAAWRGINLFYACLVIDISASERFPNATLGLVCTPYCLYSVLFILLMLPHYMKHNAITAASCPPSC